MIRTEYTRTVPIKHWLPKLTKDHSGTYLEGDFPQEVITGYKFQRAWMCDYGHFEGDRWPVDNEISKRLLLGKEVEGFEWRDEPEAP